MRKEKSLRDAKRKYKESEILKLLRKNNLIAVYDSKSRGIFDRKFQELKEDRKQKKEEVRSAAVCVANESAGGAFKLPCGFAIGEMTNASWASTCLRVSHFNGNMQTIKM